MKLIYNSLTFILGLFTLGLLATSCADEIDGPDIPQTSGSLEIPYEVDGEMPLARGVISQRHETRLNHVYILYFDKEDDDMFVDYSSVSVNSNKTTISFTPPSTLDVSHGYSLLVIGNSRDFAGETPVNKILDEMKGKSMNYAMVEEQLIAYCDDPMTYAKPGLMPMWGKYYTDNRGLEESEFRFSRDEKGNAVSESTGQFLLSRSVCRIDIQNLVGHILKIESARVINYNTSGNYFYDYYSIQKEKEEDMYIPDMAPFEPTSAPDGPGYMPITDDIVPGVSYVQKLQGSLYCFPNAVRPSVVNDSRTTALMIAGHYIKEGTDESGEPEYEEELTYYRFNLANLGSSQLLKRNYCYRATIKGVRRRGADDEQTAYNDSQPIFLYDIDDEWDTTDDNFVSDKDGNFLVVNRSHLTFSGDANEADFVELRVSTNPEMNWEIEWVEVAGHLNEYFDCKKISDSAIKVGPKEPNPNPYVRNGYLQVVATNPKTGARLTMPIYLRQMSTSFEYTTLSVNDNTGPFELELNPDGDVVCLNVDTGGRAGWVANDDGGTLTGWDAGHVTFTSGKGNTLEIRVPANMGTGPREATLIVSLAEDDQIYDDNGEKVIKDIIITLHQNKSAHLLDIIGLPETKRVDMECFITTSGNGNEVAAMEGFTIKLADSRLRWKAVSTFDYNRDMLMSTGNHRGPGSPTQTYSSQPSDGVHTGQTINSQTSGTMLWLNAFRTGPNDPMIIGTVTVTAYSADATLEVEPEELSFTVRLTSKYCEVTDVIIPNGSNYLMIADRNYGSPSRLAPDGSKREAEYYDERTSIIITNRYNSENRNQFSAFKGTMCTAHCYTQNNYINTLTYTPTNSTMLSNFKSTNKTVNEFYNSGSWRLINYDTDYSINSYIRYSKGRMFIASPFTTTEGHPVCCWIPYIYGQFVTVTDTSGSKYSARMQYLTTPNVYCNAEKSLRQVYLGDKGLIYNNIRQDNGTTIKKDVNTTYAVRFVLDLNASNFENAKTVYGLQ